MKFKNYINSLNGLGRIYSDEDLLKMMLGDVLDKEEIILAQNEKIGIPTMKELEESPNTEWIEPFKNRDGIQDGGYWQSIIEPNLYYDESFSTKKDNGNLPGIAMNNVDFTAQDFNKNTDNNFLKDSLNRVNFVNKTNNTKETVWEPSEVQLEGKIEKTNNKFINAITDTMNKYEDLDCGAAIQKAASKLPLSQIEAEYYGLQSHLKDGEQIPQKILKENDIYKYGEIEDREKAKKYTKDLAKMYGFDINDSNIEELLKNKVIVEQKSDSRISQYIKNSDVMKQTIADNYERWKNGDIREGESVEFPLNIQDMFDNEKRGLNLTLKKVGIKNIKVNDDGSISYEIRDPDDYSFLDKTDNYINNAISEINNNAYNQQEVGQLENFLFSIPQTLSKDEIEEILRKYRKRTAF